MQITRNQVVTLRYQAATRDGRVVDAGQEPLVYLHGGYGDLFDALELALQGKSVGDEFRVELSADQAFGAYDRDLVSGEPRDAFPADIQIGTRVETEGADGESQLYTVTAVDGDQVVIDGNHPLAGMDLVFSGTVAAVRPASAKEIARGEAS